MNDIIKRVDPSNSLTEKELNEIQKQANKEAGLDSEGEQLV